MFNFNFKVMAEKDLIAKVYAAFMSFPGMSEMVKIDLKISRKHALFLSSIIDRGLNAKDDGKDVGLLTNIPQETIDELKAFSLACLEKAELSDFNENLRMLSKL